MQKSNHKIEIHNTSIIINDYEFGDCTKLENYFKVYEPVTHSYYYYGMYYDENNKKLHIPRGVDIWMVEKLLGTNAYIDDSYYKYEVHDDIYIKYLPRDDIQKEALRFMIGQAEYRKTAQCPQLSVNLFTGKGKTYISIAFLAYTGIRGIVITNSIGWLKQWEEKTIEYTDISKKEIYTITGQVQIQKLLMMSEKKLKSIKLFLASHDTLQSYASNNGWDKLGDLFRYLKIGVKIYDEAHLNFMNICMIDFFTNVYKTFYLTATPIKSSERENEIYQLYFRNILAIDLFNPDKDPHTHYNAMVYNSRPDPMQIVSCENKAYGLNRNKYTNYVVYQDNFKKLLVVLMDIGLKATMKYGQKFIIYIGTNQAISIVKDYILETFPFLEDDVGIYTSIIDKEEKEKALTKRVILSTTKSAGAATDIPGLKLTIVLAEPFRSEVITRQVLGRTRDDNTMCIDVIDAAFAQCKRYYYKKLPACRMYAKSVSITKLSDGELHERYQYVLDNLKGPLMRKC